MNWWYLAILLQMASFLVGCGISQEKEPGVEQTAVPFPITLVEDVTLRDGLDVSSRQLAYCEHPHLSQRSPDTTWRVKISSPMSDAGFYVDRLVPYAHTSDMACIDYPPDDSGRNVYGLAWAPGGQELLYNFGTHVIARAKVAANGETIDVVSFLNPPKYTYYNRAHAPDWSPDGSQVAFISEFQEGPGEIGERLFAASIFVSVADGDNPRYFVQEDRLPGIVSYPAWSRDGSRLAYTLRVPSNGIGIIDVESGDVTRLDASTVEQIPVGYLPDNDIFSVFVARNSIAWFPGDNLIAFLTNSDSVTEDILWVMEPDGSNPIELHRGAVEQLALAPDGRTLAIVEAEGLSGHVLQFFHLDTTVVRENVLSAENWELVGGGGVIIRDLAWSEDGRYLAFAGNPTGQFDLFAWDMAEAAVVQLTDTAALDEIAPRWRPPSE